MTVEKSNGVNKKVSKPWIPNVFIGSSNKAKNIADIVKEELEKGEKIELMSGIKCSE